MLAAFCSVVASGDCRLSRIITFLADSAEERLPVKATKFVLVVWFGFGYTYTVYIYIFPTQCHERSFFTKIGDTVHGTVRTNRGAGRILLQEEINKRTSNHDV